MKVVICINSLEGGVANFMLNIKNALKDVFDINLILIQSNEDCRKKSFKAENTDGIDIFLYKKYGNTYKAFRNLNLLLNRADIILANDWFELGAVSNFACSYRTIFILHGDYDYYYNLARLHQDSIYKFVCVSEKIQRNLINILKDRSNDIVCINPIVPKLDEIYSSLTLNNTLKLVFVGRLVEDKGFYLLPTIDKMLQANSCKCEFYIFGSGYTNLPHEYKEWLTTSSNVYFLDYLNNKDLRYRLHQYDIFLLPSYAEGFPVSLVEAMQAGIVPIVTNLDSGVPELILDSFSGYLVNRGDALSISKIILELNSNRQLLEQMKINTLNYVTDNYSAVGNASDFKELLLKVASINPTRQGKTKKVYRSRLDNPFVPNFIAGTIRKLYK